MYISFSISNGGDYIQEKSRIIVEFHYSCHLIVAFSVYLQKVGSIRTRVSSV